MKDKNAIVAERTNEMATSEPEVITTIAFDKDAMQRDLSNGLKEFGVGCCEAGKVSLAPLASTMVKHFFNWVICSLLQ